jgi:hypothetical protein
MRLRNLCVILLNRWARPSSVAIILGQLAFAAANFFTMLAGARTLPTQQFAWVSGLWLVYAVILNAQRVLIAEQSLTLVSEPVQVRAAILCTSGLVVSASFLGISGAFLAFDSQGPVPALYTAVGALLLLYDALRFVHLGGLTPSRTLLMADVMCASSSGIAFLVTLLGGNSLSYPCIAGVGLLVSIGTVIEPTRPSLRALGQFIGSIGDFAAWGTIQVIAANLTSQLLVLLCLPFVSGSEFAGLRAIQALFGPITTPAQAVQPMIFRTWLARERSGFPWMRWYVVWLASGTVVVWLFIASSELWGSELLEVAISPSFAQYHNLVPPVLLVQGIVWLSAPGGVHLRVLRWGRSMATAQGAAVMCGALLVWLMSRLMGISGTAWALSGQALLSAAFAYVLLFRGLMHRAGTPATTTPGGTDSSANE